MHVTMIPLLLTVVSLVISATHASSWHLISKDEERSTLRVNYKEEWFTQQLDHFDRSNEKVWQQRYRVDTQFFTSDGPVFILISGESATLSKYYLENGLMFDLARKHKGVMFHIEHRFYGISKPTDDTSTPNLRYLTSDQGLADLATFTAWVKKRYSTSKVFIFGGSYAGDLSAWFQQRYHHLVDGVFSASAPYLAQVDFPEYADTIQYVTNAEAPGCYDRFVEGIQQIEKLYQSQKDVLKAKFQLCDDMKSTDNADLYSLIDNLISPFAGAVQYGDQSRDQTFNNAHDVCSNLTSVNDALEGLIKVNTMFLKGKGESCLLTYQGMLDAIRNTSWESSALISRGWIWQTCTEFGWYQTYTDGKATTFLPLSYFLQLCSDIYGPEYGVQKFVSDNVDRTNVYNGGYKLTAEKAIIWNGNYDPWSRVSILTPINGTDNHVFNVAKNSHCAVMRSASTDITAEASDVRQQIMDIFERWINGEPTSAATSTLNVAATSKAILIATALLYIRF